MRNNVATVATKLKNLFKAADTRPICRRCQEGFEAGQAGKVAKWIGERIGERHVADAGRLSTHFVSGLEDSR